MQNTLTYTQYTQCIIIHTYSYQYTLYTVRWVAGVLDDPPGFPYTPPGVDILEGGKLTSNNVAGRSHDPLQSFAVARTCVVPPQAHSSARASNRCDSGQNKTHTFKKIKYILFCLP